MKSRLLTNGTVLIIIGVIFLLRNLGIPTVIPWVNLWQLWPMFLVVLGLQILFPRGVLSIIAPVVLVFTLVIAFLGAPLFPWTTPDYMEASFPLQTDVSHGELRVQNVPVANISLQANTALHPPAVLFGGERTLIGDWGATQRDTSGIYTVKGHRSLGGQFSTFNGSRAQLDLSINPTLDWNFNFDIAVINGRLDLTDLLWSNLVLSSGIANLTIRLGTAFADGAEIHINSGISRVALEVSQDVGLRITTSTPSFLHNLERSGFDPLGDSYISPAYLADDPPKVHLIINSGISTISLNWI